MTLGELRNILAAIANDKSVALPPTTRVIFCERNGKPEEVQALLYDFESKSLLLMGED